MISGLPSKKEEVEAQLKKNTPQFIDPNGRRDTVSKAHMSRFCLRLSDLRKAQAARPAQSAGRPTQAETANRVVGSILQLPIVDLYHKIICYIITTKI